MSKRLLILPSIGSGIVVQPWGSAADPDEFEVELLASHPAGVGRVRAEVEACPAGVAFEELACTTTLSPAWTQLVPETPDPLLSTTMSGLAPGTLYHGRARILYVDATGPIPTNPAHGPWRRLGGQSVEGDIRTVPEPGELAGSLVGCALLFGMQRRRMGGVLTCLGILDSFETPGRSAEKSEKHQNNRAAGCHVRTRSHDPTLRISRDGNREAAGG